jgi:hypothetical protein
VQRNWSKADELIMGIEYVTDGHLKPTCDFHHLDGRDPLRSALVNSSSRSRVNMASFWTHCRSRRARVRSMDHSVARLLILMSFPPRSNLGSEDGRSCAQRAGGAFALLRSGLSGAHSRPHGVSRCLTGGPRRRRNARSRRPRAFEELRKAWEWIQEVARDH